MNVRKTIALFLALAVMSSAQGFAFTAHFCGDKLAALDFFSNETDDSCRPEKSTNTSCCEIKAKESKPCCSNKTIELKGKKDFIAEKYPDIQSLAAEFSDLGTGTRTILSKPKLNKNWRDFVHNAHAPPLYILFCSLKINLS